jgi:hypothetical protein
MRKIAMLVIAFSKIITGYDDIGQIFLRVTEKQWQRDREKEKEKRQRDRYREETETKKDGETKRWRDRDT